MLLLLCKTIFDLGEKKKGAKKEKSPNCLENVKLTKLELQQEQKLTW